MQQSAHPFRRSALALLAALSAGLAQAANVATPTQACLYSGAGNGKPLSCSSNTADTCVAAVPLAKAGATFTCKVSITVVAPPPPPPPPPPPLAAVTAWVHAANTDYTRDPVSAPVGSTVRFGDGFTWATATMRDGMVCTADQFGVNADALGMAYTKWCELQVTAPAVTQIDGAMPVVNKGLIPLPSIMADGPRVITLTPEQLALPGFNPAPSTEGGAFRVSCPYSHISNDDPIVHPGLPGAAHLHTWAGNTRADASSTFESLSTTGASTCGGGTLNRTAYWFPSLIDIRTGQPIVPLSTNFYYKTGYQGVDPKTIVPFPKGLRMIAGNAAATTMPAGGSPANFRCVGGPNNQNLGLGAQIGWCDVGAQLWQSVDFPQCWDGVNLDSADHKAHMAYGAWRATLNEPGGCPATHPVALPAITLNTQYLVTEKGIENIWRLSSDHYAGGQGGYSLHADWFGAWDEATMNLWVTNCLNRMQDCHNHLLGDGRMLY